MPPPHGTPTEVNHDMILGEMRGQLREVVHSVNNLTQKFDALAREVIGMSGLGAELVDMKARIVVLEVDRNRHAGAVGVVETILKSPMLGWIVGMAITGFAVIKGWVKIP